MPPNTSQSFKAGLTQLKKRFKEFEKLQQKQWKTRQKQMRVEKKYQREEVKKIRKVHKEKERAMRKEFRLKDQERRKQQRAEQKLQRARQKQQRNNQRSRAQEKRHVRGLNREMKRGPLGRAARGVGRAAAFAGGGLVGFAIGAAIRGYQDYTTANKAMGPMIGTGARSRDAWRAKSRGRAGGGYRGGNLGFNVAERAALIPGMARATGATSPVAMMEAMRATGMGSGEVAGIFGALRQGGSTFTGREGKGAGNQGKREFKNIIAAGMASGLERGRLPEFFSGITNLMKTQQQMAAGDVGSGDLSKIAGMLGRTGQSGFQGQRGMNVMAKLQQGIMKPGGGEAGMAFMRQAMGFGKPGGDASFYEAEKAREKGLNSENFTKIMNELKTQYGTGEDAALKMRELFGVSLDQAETLIKVSDSNQSMEEKMKAVDEVMTESKSLEEQAAIQMKSAATNLKRIAGKFDESAARGASAAKAIEAVEDFQKKLWELMKKWVPIIAGGIQQLVSLVMEIVNYIKNLGFSQGAGGQTGKEAAATDAVGKARQQLMFAGRAQRQKIAAQLRRKSSRLFSASVTAESGRLFQFEGGKFSRKEGKRVARHAQFEASFIPAFYDAAGIDKPTLRDKQQMLMAMGRAKASSKRREGKSLVLDVAMGGRTGGNLGREWAKKRMQEAERNKKSKAPKGKKTGALSAPAGPKTAALDTGGEMKHSVDVNLNFPAGVNTSNGPVRTNSRDASGGLPT